MNFALIVFDLDFTLWNAGGTWCDHTTPPYARQNGHVLDSMGNIIFLYPASKSVLKTLYTHYTLAVASRTHRPEWARELMDLLDIRKYFSHLEIYPGPKTEHFYQLQNNTQFDFEEMLFFDDEMRNVDEVASLNVKTVLVDQGITQNLVFSQLA
jgi:magnesium-dependent phosphatase 1